MIVYAIYWMKILRLCLISQLLLYNLFYILQPMLEQHNLLPRQYCTPIKTRSNLDQTDSEEDQESTQGRSSITKSYSIPSTVDSPALRPNSPSVFFELDLSTVLWEEGERCADFHERGFCERGKECLQLHVEGVGWMRPRKYEMISNFPELVVIHAPRRVRSFLE